MKRTLAYVVAFALCISMPLSTVAGDNGYGVTYDGGSVSNVKAGAGVRLPIEVNQVFRTRSA